MTETLTGAFYGENEEQALAKAFDWLTAEPQVERFELGQVTAIREGHSYSVTAEVSWRRSLPGRDRGTRILGMMNARNADTS